MDYENLTDAMNAFIEGALEGKDRSYAELFSPVLRASFLSGVVTALMLLGTRTLSAAELQKELQCQLFRS